MPLSNNWLRFRSLEEKYFTCRYNLMQDKDTVANDLGIALRTAHDRETALRLLAETNPEAAVVWPLLPMILEAAIDSSLLTTIELARQVLCNYKAEPQTRILIQAIVTDYLPTNDEWNYRRIAELYNLLDYKAELASFVKVCQMSTNPEIREVGEDFDL